MSCAEGSRHFDDDQRRTLLATARQSIDHGLRHGRPLEVELAAFEGDLRAPGACFVTLRGPDARLRGCMGSSQALRPLVQDVARNAFSAAFLDPRFPPLERVEVEGLHLHLSVLSPLELLAVASAAELLERVRPGVDGLLVEEGTRRGTLLPSVWEALPDAAHFLQEVRRKAGLPGDYWSPTLRVFRYTAESFD